MSRPFTRAEAAESLAGLAELLRKRFDDMTPWEAVESARTLLHFVFGHTQSTQMLLQAQEFAALAAGRPADAAADPPGASRADLDVFFERGGRDHPRGDHGTHLGGKSH
ncbi:hypothetical protein ACSHWG_09685 [Leucobacter sp. Z1108]|uniref:hypothetical protein n=1 Tax=Leucobacter sp. Z1108 TaxID=3439066 RepID=UPI003F2FFE02